MKYGLGILLFFLIHLGLKGQDEYNSDEGAVSYITSQHVYVKFKSTESIKVGDSLFVQKEGKLIPVLLVKNLSSISCVCQKLDSNDFNLSDRIFTKYISKLSISKDKITVDSIILKADIQKDTTSIDKIEIKEYKQDIQGYIAVASYSNFSNTIAKNSQRMRYTLSLNADNLNNSKLSLESYFSFRHKQNEWDEIKNNLNSALKIFRLAAKYKLNENIQISAGRTINRKISNIGAVDGLQIERTSNQFSYGAIAGSRPDYKDYSYNFNLFQFGAYLSHNMKLANRRMQNSIALVEQKNNWITDRRFAYFQHSNSLIDNLYLYSTFELDLYKKLNNIPETTLSLSGLYLSLRYRMFKKLTFTASYDARNNIIYYETYKSSLDQLIESETRQGYRFLITYRPLKFMTVGVKVGYRFQKNDPKSSKNLYSYISYSNIPWLNVSTTISNTLLQTSYLDGKLFGVTINRDIIPGKLYAGITYRYVNYQFYYSEIPLIQNVTNMSLNWRIYKKLSFSVSYEGSFEDVNRHNRIYINVRQRF